MSELVASDPQAEVRQVGEISAACRVAPDLLLLLGWQRERPSPAGTSALQRTPGRPGRFRRVSWSVPTAQGELFRFLAAVHLPGTEVRDGDSLVMSGRRALDGEIIAHLPAFSMEPVVFGGELARFVSGDAGANLAKFLQSVIAAAPSVAPAVRAVQSAFLQAVSEPDGCVEILGALRDQCMILQGWGRPLEAQCDVVLLGDELSHHQARLAGFDRADVGGSAIGQVVLLPGARVRPDSIATMFLLARDGVRRRRVLPECRVLSEEEAVGHVRTLLPELRCHTDTLALVAAALRPVFDGRLTLYDAGHPVRFEIDLAMTAPGAGAYLTGWLFDPFGLVESLHLRSTGEMSARIDDSWTRIPRDDVTAAFRSEPHFAGASVDRLWHGFAAHVTDRADAQSRYIEVGFRDGGCGFVPLTLSAITGKSDLARLLASVDLHKPSGNAVIERQLAPFLARVRLNEPASVGSAPDVSCKWTSLIVVPLSQTRAPRALLSQFLVVPLEPHEGVLFVCGDRWTEEATASLARLARFYGVPAAIARLDGNPSAQAALRIAGKFSAAEHFLLLRPGVVGRTPGWRTALQLVSRDGGNICVSPTVLYEDGSIRFAGCKGVEPLEAEPYVRFRRPLTGLPAAFAQPGPPSLSHGLSAACFLLPRRALGSLAAVSDLSVFTGEQELELALLLRHAGVIMSWAPGIQVYATEDGATSTDPVVAAQLVARWCARALFSVELA